MTDQYVISLCESSGNMVRPWARDGYQAMAVDLKNDGSTETVGDGEIRYIEADVTEFCPDIEDCRIAFGFPPCTDLAVSGARWMEEKGLHRLSAAISTVAHCRDTLSSLDCPWMLENPVSTLSTYWRDPDHRFDPYQYDGYTMRDERYTKETCLWVGGGFRMPVTDGVSESEADDRIHKHPPSEERSENRSRTPTGFAHAVYLSHTNPEEYARHDSDGCVQTDLTDLGQEGSA